MISTFEGMGAGVAPCNDKPVAVALPRHLPVDRIFLHRLHKGEERWVLLSNEAGQLLGILANGLSLQLGEFIDRADWPGGATRCAYTENLFNVGYAMITYSAAQWLTREVRTVLDMRPHVRQMLDAGYEFPKVEVKGGGAL